MRAFVFANGDANDGPVVRAVLADAAESLIIAADGGLHMVEQFGLHPHYVIGDMDSALPDALDRAHANGAKIIRYPAAKDETDLELALLKAADRDCDPIYIIGAVGNRLDQTIGNIYLLALPQLRNRQTYILSHRQTTWLAYPGTTTIDGHPGDTVSLVPMAGDAESVSTDGLQYPLQAETLKFGPARGISNVMFGTQATVTFDRGLLLVTHSIGRA